MSAGKIADLAPGELRARLRGGRLRLRFGPAVFVLRSSLPAVADGIALHYAQHGCPGSEEFANFHVSVDRPRGLRGWVRPQVRFLLDGEAPFTPLPGDQGFPMLEWGMNWCVYSHLHRYLILHAAVVERGGRALVLPAPPGSGKSTLAAGLVWRGWRLLSDELTMIEPASGHIVPLPRPVSLKNASIDVIRAFAPQARFGPIVHETTKGSVGHFSPPADAVQRAGEHALPGWIVLPRWRADTPATLTPLTPGRALMALVDNAFNYNVHGRQGFETLSAFVQRCRAYSFEYSRLEEATALFTAMADALPPADG